jgi:glycosyltransferase involved in cell wall biosynthesis
VTIIPCVIEPQTTTTVSRATFNIREDATVFFFNFDALSTAGRKNPLGLISAFMSTFSDAERASGVQLVIKTHNLDRVPKLATELRDAMEAASGLLIDEELSRIEMNSLIACSDVYASLHRCEGFGLGIAEAMALGKPVIATAFSANMDFTHPENSALVGYDIRRVTSHDHRHFPEASSLYPEGLRWAEPDPWIATRWMRLLADRPDLRRELGARGRATISGAYSRATASTRVVERLEEIRQRRSAD